jgi:hypothetical protein
LSSVSSRWPSSALSSPPSRPKNWNSTWTLHYGNRLPRRISCLSPKFRLWLLFDYFIDLHYFRLSSVISEWTFESNCESISVHILTKQIKCCQPKFCITSFCMSLWTVIIFFMTSVLFKWLYWLSAW